MFSRRSHNLLMAAFLGMGQTEQEAGAHEAEESFPSHGGPSIECCSRFVITGFKDVLVSLHDKIY